MATKAELKRKAHQPKLKVRKGDKVVITAGKDKGELGWIAALDPVKMKALVLQDNPENPDNPFPLNSMIKHKKARYQGEKSARVKLPAPIHISNLMVLDPESEVPTKIGRRKEDGKIVRYGKKTGKTIRDTPNMEEK